MTRSLVLRLAGPVQSWGEHSPFTLRSSLPYPTYSGLLGMARAALGMSRSTATSEWKWLLGLDIWVRLDRTGQSLADYHSVNPPKADLWDSAYGPRRRAAPFTVPIGEQRRAGAAAKAWTIKSQVPTLLTERHYVTDAAFTVVLAGNDDRIGELHEVFESPGWQISLGRKACLPDWPLALGTGELSPSEAAVTVPATPTISKPKSTPVVSTDVHILSGEPPAGAFQLTHTDHPLGSHPHSGYTTHTRWTLPVTSPGATRAELLEWATENLEQLP